jgi:Uma2 family endonuclease
MSQMSALRQSQNLMTHEEYFVLERSEDRRHEYHAGEIFAMAGGSESHALIGANALAGLSNALRGKPCRVYGADMKLYIRAHDLFVYPDVQVLCERGLRQGRYVENSSLVVEVLSPSTESYDRGMKFEYYRSIESLSYYLLIDQTRRHVELFERQSQDRWLLTEPGERLVFDALEASLDIDEIYRQVEFAATASDG